MTENLSFREDEHSPAEQSTVLVDILAQPTWSLFCENARMVECDAESYSPRDDEDIVRAGKDSHDLTAQFGLEYDAGLSTIVGMAYDIYRLSDDDKVESKFLDTSSAIFHGVNVCYFNNKWQVTLEFYCAERSEDMENGIYNVPIDQILSLAIEAKVSQGDDYDVQSQEEPEQKAIRGLKQGCSLAREFVHGDNLIGIPPIGQRILLEGICSDATREFLGDIWGNEQVVDCLQYYTEYDNQIPGFSFRNFPTDLSETPPEVRRPITGVVTALEYPELKALPEESLVKSADLDVNDGAYCLVLRNENEGVTYYVIPQSIIDIY